MCCTGNQASRKIVTMKHRQTPDSGRTATDQDTPGRPKPAAGRQQTHPNQGNDTGNPHIDSKTPDSPRNHHVRNEK